MKEKIFPVIAAAVASGLASAGIKKIINKIKEKRKIQQNRVVKKILPKLKNKKIVKMLKLVKQKNKQVIRQNAPAAVGNSIGRRKPRFYSTADGVGIQHCEAVDLNLPGSTVWTQQGAYNINPGNANVFQWLSQMANLFEYYQFRKLIFRYIPNCGSSTSGSIQMAPDYDSSDPAPFSENIFSSYADFTDAVVWMESQCQFDMRALNAFSKWHYVIQNNQVVNSSSPLYNAAQFFIYTTGGANANSIGKIYVDYDIELKTPTVNANGSGPIGGQISSNGSATKAAILTNTAPGNYSSGISCKTNANGASEVDFNTIGTYLVTTVMTGTGITNCPSLSAVSGTYTTVNLLEYFPNAAATAAMAVYAVTITNASSGVYFGTAVWTTLTSFDVYVATAPQSSLGNL